MVAIGTCGPALAEEVLRVGGTGGTTAAMQRIAGAFTAATGIKMLVVPSLGSTGAIRAVGDGKLDVAVSGRSLTTEEINRGFVSVLFARTALVFVTSHPKPDGLKSVELTKIFLAQSPKWADGTPINIVMRTKLDADTILLVNNFPGISAAIDTARQRADVPVAATDQDSFDLAERLPGSFVQAGLSQFLMEPNKLSLVTLDGVEPTLANLESGKYPYDKPFFLVFPAQRSPQAQRLMDFLQTPEGVKILRSTGNLPVGK
jgi:phosphate transport system substrate-binding protein